MKRFTWQGDVSSAEVLMVLAESHTKHSFMKRLKEELTCSTPEEVDQKGWVSWGSKEVEGGTAVLHR